MYRAVFYQLNTIGQYCAAEVYNVLKTKHKKHMLYVHVHMQSNRNMTEVSSLHG